MQAVLQQAVALHRQGNLAGAEMLYRQLLASPPHYADALHLLGTIALQRGQPDEAIAQIEQAIAVAPQRPHYHANLAGAYRRAGRITDALASYDHALALKPDSADVLNNRGIALQACGRHADALASYDRAIALRPDYADAFANRGRTLQDLGRHDEALASYDRAIALRPAHADALYDRGTALQALDRHADALASYEAAIAARPDFAQAHVNTSLCLLKLGDMARGWAEYEWRWKIPHLAGGIRDLHRPLWLGREPVEGRTILLHFEQGFGDTLQFCRFASQVAARGAQVVLQVQRPLVRLLAGLGTVVAAGDRLPPFDLHCPLLSLPLALGTTVATIPAPAGYLAADPALVAAWERRLEGLPGRRVGLVWAGSSREHAPELMPIDRRRSITLAQLAPLAAVPGVSFVSLQKGEAAAQTRSPPMPVHDETDQLHDFADTAALIAALDLVISVDTAVAHLAGALGRPVWILNRFDACWRWLLDRSDSPWYRSARLFRQPTPGDWTSVIADVAAALG